jgi:hypothetical protein
VKTLLTTVLLLLAGATALAQANANTTKPSLRLTTSITEQRYCESGYPDMAQVSMSLELTYTNVGEGPVILYKGSNLAHFIRVSLNEQNARDKKYELDQHVGWVSSVEPIQAEDSEPGSEFAVLFPGESYKAKTDILFPVGLGRSDQFLKPGKYVMQIVVEAWRGENGRLGRLRDKWEKSGFLWGSPVESEPMPIEVEKEPKVVQCKGNV